MSHVTDLCEVCRAIERHACLERHFVGLENALNATDFRLKKEVSTYSETFELSKDVQR